MGIRNAISSDNPVAGLEALDREALLARWKAVFRGPVPKHLSQPLMVRTLAWQAQADMSGGLSASTARALGTLSRQCSSRSGEAGPLPAGSRLLREWNGRTHVVDVSEAGYVWQGRAYRSLSAIAREITGAHWSGPRFFGLKVRAGRL